MNRVLQTIEDINRYNSSAIGITRLAYSAEAKEAMNHIFRLCEQEQLNIHIDACGNLIARREGINPALPAVACGSHIDTVIEGGRFDGLLGVVSGLEVIRRLNEKRIKTIHPVELIVFASEEASRFGIGRIGSKAMTGDLKNDLPALETLTDGNEMTIQEAFEVCNLDFKRIEESFRNPDVMKVFFELHIEQGPVLEENRKKVGIVTGIAAPTRFLIKVSGKASHTGTTPMENRKDALLGASEMSLALEDLTKNEIRSGTVATVSGMKVHPGAINVIPGFVEMKIDIRSISKSSKALLAKRFLESVEKIASKRGLTVEKQLIGDEDPVILNDLVISQLNHSAKKLGIPYINMPSGAGHDAMSMNKLCPSGMIFVPSKEGLSHHPDEHTSIEDINSGIDLLEEQIIVWANGKEGVC